MRDFSAYYYGDRQAEIEWQDFWDSLSDCLSRDINSMPNDTPVTIAVSLYELCDMLGDWE